MSLSARTIDTPLGRFRASATPAGLVSIAWPDAAAAATPEAAPTAAGDRHLARLAEQMAAYFAGRTAVFDLALDMRGTPFQRAVWRALRTIAPGHTRSYGALAAAIGRPGAARAVGAAAGANPLPLIVPCHRLVGADGRLTGFAGGLANKRALLDHEAVFLRPADVA